MFVKILSFFWQKREDTRWKENVQLSWRYSRASLHIVPFVSCWEDWGKFCISLQVHTSKQKVKIYEQISELRGVFTTDCSARIHACAWQVQNNMASSLLKLSYCSLHPALFLCLFPWSLVLFVITLVDTSIRNWTSAIDNIQGSKSQKPTASLSQLHFYVEHLNYS